MKSLRILLLVAVLAVPNLPAQSQAPIVVQAVPEPGTATIQAPAAPVTSAPSNEATMKLLQEIKAANDAILTRQAATLQQLDEIEKAAEQIKVYSKRG